MAVLAVGCQKNEQVDRQVLESPQAFETKEINVYYADDNAEYILAHTAMVAEVSGTGLVNKLIQYGVLNNDVALLSMEEKEEEGKKVLYLDFNQAFQSQLSSLGSAGERVLMGSVINTFLDAFEAKAVQITVEGKTLESGNQIYDEPEKRYSATEDTYQDYTVKKKGKKKKIEVKRACIKTGYAFWYDYKKFRFKENPEDDTFVLESKKKKNGTPVISMTGELCENSVEGELLQMMGGDEKENYESAGPESIGKNEMLLSGKVVGNPKKKKTDKLYYIIPRGTVNSSEIGTYKLTITGYKNALMDSMQICLDTMEYVAKNDL